MKAITRYASCNHFSIKILLDKGILKKSIAFWCIVVLTGRVEAVHQQQDLVQQQVVVECGDFILKTHLDLKCEFKVVFYFWKPFYSYYRYIKLIVIFLIPLNPKIKIWILICCPYSFPTSLQISDKMSSKFILRDHVRNSHDHSVLQSTDITRRNLILITLRA